ncbi:hypothetical protein BH18THE2_BH18THE2_25800 [soil metagenome]
MDSALVKHKIVSLAFTLTTVLTILSASGLTIITTTTIDPIQAETGKGEDIFKVIMTIFGIDRSKGDVIAIVTVNNGEASRVKFLDAEAPYVVSTTNDTGTSAGLIEYTATFPNVTVNAGNEYKACVVPIKDLELTCKTGNNSPAARPEFVDMSLNATTAVRENTGEEEDGE